MAAYQPKNILVTGGAGFIASHVVVALVKDYPQYNVVNFDKLDYCSNLKNLECIENAPNYTFIKGNILSADLLNYVLKTHKIDTILHFAAQTHVDNSFGNSIQFTLNNVLGTHVLLEAAKVSNVSRFIHVSTDEVYGEIDLTTSRLESEALEPTNPYAATKAGAEFLVKAYHKSFNLPIIITRGNNVYGPNQYPEKIIPKFICLLEKGKPLYIHGDGSHRRNYVYVSDVVDAFKTILHQGVIGEVYNIGTNCELSNIQVARKLLAFYGRSEEESHWIKFVKDRPFNDKRYHINSDKLNQLGWRPQVDWDEGLRLTVEWYKNNYSYWAELEHALQPHPSALPPSAFDDVGTLSEATGFTA